MPETVPVKTWEQESHKVYFVSGWTNLQLAIDTTGYLGIDLREPMLKKFPNGELYARYDEESIRGKDLYILQSHVEVPGLSVDGAIKQQRLLTIAARDAGAHKVHVIAPVLGYQRQDRKAAPRAAMAAQQVIKDIQNDGADTLTVFDLHAGQLQGSFEGSFDAMTAVPLLVAKMHEIKDGDDPDRFILMGADASMVKLIERYAGQLGVETGYINKIRDDQGNITSTKVVGEVAGRIVWMIDDMIDTAGTIAHGSDKINEQRSKEIYLFATHGFFSGNAPQTLAKAPIKEIYVTDTIAQAANQKKIHNLGVLSVNQLLGDTVAAIQTDTSVSAVFGGQNLT